MGWDENDPELIMFRAEMKLYTYDIIKDGGFFETIFTLCDGKASEYNAVMELDLLTASQFLLLKEKSLFAQWYANKKIEEFRDL